MWDKWTNIRGRKFAPLTRCHFAEDLKRLRVSWLDGVQPACGLTPQEQLMTARSHSWKTPKHHKNVHMSANDLYPSLYPNRDFKVGTKWKLLTCLGQKFIMLFNGELNLISNTEPWTCHPRTQKPTWSKVIWHVIIKQISHWSKRAFSVMLYTLTYICQTSVANICQTKAVSHVNADLGETIEGVNMTFPPVPKQRLPSVQLQAFLPPAP